MDNTLNMVKTVRTGGGLASADQHEFRLINGGNTALMMIYHPIPYDLTPYNVTGGQGWIMENTIQEVDTRTFQVLFEWSASDHVDPSEAYILPNTTDVSGDGKTKTTPWDYL